MSDKFQDKYRIKSARLENWDYSWDGLYFVTICTQNRESYFGDILKDEMILSEIGELAKKYWLEIPQHFPFIELVSFVVMPNHIHGVVIINNTKNMDKDAINRVSTINTIATERGGITGLNNPMLSDGLSKIIRWYKGRTSFDSRKKHYEFTWQSRFHDHIIRDDDSFQNIVEYIDNNPSTWNEDTFYKSN
jgi:REP element-mobilizing transposase RayT